MKKIVIITPACHFKNAGAAQRDIYSTIASLQKLGHQVVLYTIGSPEQDQSTLNGLAVKYQIPVSVFTPKATFWSRISSMIMNPSLFDGAAFVFDQLCKNQDFLDYLKHEKIDCIFSFCSYSWPVLKLGKKLNIRTIFRSHNFESSFFWESLEYKQKLNPLNWLRVFAKYFGEKNAVHWADAVGSLPFEQIKKYYFWKKEAIKVLTLTFLPESLRPPKVNAGKVPLDLFYLGASYNVIFHLRGAEMLIEQVAPKILALTKGEFRFHICGSKLPQRLVEKCKDGVIYEGYVENLENFLNGMDAGVFPVMTGKTMKGKVFESLARAFPVVMSKNCLGGYNLVNGEQFLLADTVEEFVQKILSLRDLQLRKHLAEGAHSLALREFSEDAIQSVLRNLVS